MFPKYYFLIILVIVFNCWGLAVEKMDYESGIIYLENKFVKFGFDKATGSLVDIFDKVTSYHHLKNPEKGRLFRVVVPSKTWISRYADSHESGSPSFEHQGNSLRITYNKLQSQTGPIDIHAVVTIALAEDDSEALFSLELINNGPDMTHEVRFPWVAGWNGDYKNEKGYCGVLPIKQLWSDRNEVLTFNMGGNQRRYLIPMWQAQLPFVDMTEKGKGISYICYQNTPHLGGVVIENLNPEPGQRLISWSWLHYPFVKPGDRWESSPVGISVHQSDWHATSKRFRKWLLKWWKPSKKTNDLNERLGMQVVMLRGFDGKPMGQFSKLPEIAKAGLKYGITDIQIWDPMAGIYCRYDKGDFWEPYDDQTPTVLSKYVKQTRELGVDVATLVNYRLISRDSPQWKERGERMAQRTYNGNVISEDWSGYSEFHGSMSNKYLSLDGCALCQKSPEFQERALSWTGKTLDLGFGSIFFDMAFEHTPCFAENHGHHNPEDTYEGALNWSKSAACMVKKSNPKAYIMGECVDYLFAQHVDLSWVWSWESEWIRIMRYTLPELIPVWVVDHQPEILNQIFVLNCWAAFKSGAMEKTLADYPDFAEKAACLVELRKKTARFMAHGEFQDKTGLNVEGDAEAYIYQSFSGLAVAIAEIKNNNSKIKLSVDLSKFNFKDLEKSVLYTEAGKEISSGSIDKNMAELTLELKPFDVAVWVLSEGK